MYCFISHSVKSLLVHIRDAVLQLGSRSPAFSITYTLAQAVIPKLTKTHSQKKRSWDMNEETMHSANILSDGYLSKTLLTLYSHHRRLHSVHISTSHAKPSLNSDISKCSRVFHLDMNKHI